jgi:hypothetical protein
VSNGSGWLQPSSEMHIFQAEVGRDERFMTEWYSDGCTVVPDAEHSPSAPRAQAQTANKSFFG